jgi:tetratricopeptide (TPR) repeat protein
MRLAFSIIQSGKRLDEAGKILNSFLDEAKHPAAEFSPRMRGLLYLVRAEYALATSDVPGAHTWLKKSLDTFEASAEAHNLAGRLAALNKDGAKALNEFSRAIALDPRLPKVYFDRSRSMFALGQKTEAVDKLKDFERYLKPTVAYHIERGNLLMQMDDMQAALNEFQSAMKVDELNPDARFHVALCYQRMGEKLGDAKEKKAEKLALYNQAREEYENTIILPGGERPEVYHMMGRIYLDSEDADNALDKLGKAVLMMQKAGDPSDKIAVLYVDISRVFKYLGGTEGERQEKVYLAKAEALRRGKTIEEVEKEWAEREKKSKKKRRRRRRRRR